MKKGYLFFAALLLLSGALSYLGFSYGLPRFHFNVKTETWKLFGLVTLNASILASAAVLLFGFLDLRERNIRERKLLTSGRS